VRLILASSSPRRRELLGLLGLTPEIIPANIDERRGPGESPTGYVERLAQEKATVVAAKHQGAVVIAADTTVALGDEIFEKPLDVEDGVRILSRIQGRDHVVHTGMAVVYDGHTVSGVETTRVWMRPMDDRMIRDYLATGEPMDKAGAYAIQGGAAQFIERISGDFDNVVGLPMALVHRLLSTAGGSYPER
jgi:septum formation protein